MPQSDRDLPEVDRDEAEQRPPPMAAVEASGVGEVRRPDPDASPAGRDDDGWVPV